MQMTSADVKVIEARKGRMADEMEGLCAGCAQGYHEDPAAARGCKCACHQGGALIYRDHVMEMVRTDDISALAFSVRR